jgi:Leucine-rich repeat (LRR) protein
MILEGSMCDELSEVNTLMLRDKGIDVFDDVKGPDGFKLTDLFNIECLLASHNKLKDVFGISQLTSLVELNLSFNEISDIQ